MRSERLTTGCGCLLFETGSVYFESLASPDATFVLPLFCLLEGLTRVDDDDGGKGFALLSLIGLSSVGDLGGRPLVTICASFASGRSCAGLQLDQ